MNISQRYTGDEYSGAHPDWHIADSPWKAAQLLAAIGDDDVSTVCEVGCGAGEILRQLHDRMPNTDFVGYEIAQAALTLAAPRTTDRLKFELADAASTPATFDLMLIIDVIEHVADPILFLSRLRHKAKRTLLHIPLDLSIQSVARPTKLLQMRQEFGHIHYFTPETAIATVGDAGYRVRRTSFTRTFDLPAQSLKARLARVPRRVLPRSLTVRALGGYSILIDAAND